MATSRLPLRPWQYRLVAIMTGVTLVTVAALLTATAPAAGQSDLELGTLTVSDVNRTVDGDVSDVQIDAQLDYSHDVPDATRRIVTLKAGPSADNLETVTFAQESGPAGTDSGSVSLSGSLTELDAYSASDFDPALADSQTRTVVVAAEIEVRRESGEPVVTQVTEPVTIQLHDGAVLSADVGGSGDITVNTD